MSPRPLLTAILATLALPVVAQTPPPAQAPTQALVIPKHGCVAPEYPGKANLTKLRGDAYNRAIEGFNRDYKAYGDCIKKYVDDTKEWVKAVADSGNTAVDEYNKFNEELRKKIAED